MPGYARTQEGNKSAAALACYRYLERGAAFRYELIWTDLSRNSSGDNNDVRSGERKLESIVFSGVTSDDGRSIDMGDISSNSLSKFRALAR